MADKTGIEWADATWNPIRGCSRVSEGCRHCYAETVAARFSGPGLPYEGLITKTRQGPTWNGKIKLVPEVLEQPLRWQKPRVIFVNSMSDLFHEAVPDEYLPDVFAVMAAAKRHSFPVLTKRPERMREVLNDGIFFEAVACSAWEKYKIELTADDWPLSNVWLGVSVEDQATADERIPLLLQTPAAVRWISAEPLLGPVGIREFMWPVHPRWPAKYRSSSEAIADGANVTYHRQALISKEWANHLVNWVVVGGESGNKARPMHPDWAAGLRDQCASAGVPFLFKQWGEWMPTADLTKTNALLALGIDERYIRLDGTAHGIDDVTPYSASDVLMACIGKKRAGRLLDGVQHDGYPRETP